MRLYKRVGESPRAIQEGCRVLKQGAVEPRRVWVVEEGRLVLESLKEDDVVSGSSD